MPTNRKRCTHSSYIVVFLPNRRLRLGPAEHAHASVHAQATVRFGPKMVHEPFWLRPTCLTPLPRESRGPLRNRLLDKRRVKSTPHDQSRRMIGLIHRLTVTLHPENVRTSIDTTRAQTLLSWHRTPFPESRDV